MYFRSKYLEKLIKCIFISEKIIKKGDKMKSLALTLTLTFVTIALSTTSLLAATTSMPVKADMQSMIEGQIVYEVPLNSHVKKGQLVEEVDPAEYKADLESDAAIINYNNIAYKTDLKLYKTRSVSLADLLLHKEDLEKALAQYQADLAILKHCKIYEHIENHVKIHNNIENIYGNTHDDIRKYMKKCRNI